MNRKNKFGLLLLLAPNDSHFVMNELRTPLKFKHSQVAVLQNWTSLLRQQPSAELDRNLKTGQVIAECW